SLARTTRTRKHWQTSGQNDTIPHRYGGYRGEKRKIFGRLPRLSGSVQPQCIRHALGRFVEIWTVATWGTADTLLQVRRNLVCYENPKTLSFDASGGFRRWLRV